MDSALCMSSEEEPGPSSMGSKKRKKTGISRDVMKVLRATTHELGPDCKCTRFHYFTTERRRIIRECNELGSTDVQNSYLSGLVIVLPVMRRRPRKDKEELKVKSATFAYRVRVKVDGDTRDVPVCSFTRYHRASS